MSSNISLCFLDNRMKASIKFSLALNLALLFALPIGAQEVRALPEPGKTTQRELKGGDKHEYRLTAKPGQFLHLTATQRGLDVVISLTGPDKKQLIRVNNPNGTQTVETLMYVSEMDGEHIVEVGTTTREKRTASYVLTVNELRDSTSDDRQLAAGMLAKAEADALMEQGNEESKKLAFKKYEEAARSFLQARDKKHKASLMRSLAQIYDDIVYEREKAIEYYRIALSIYQELDQKADAVIVLNDIGIAFENLFEYQDAVNSYEKALEIAVELNDRPLQAKTYNQLGRGHARQGDFQRSLHDFQQALALNDGKAWNHDISVTLMGLSVVYDALGNVERGLAYALQNVELLEKNSSASQVAAQLLNIGNIYRHVGNYPQAEEYYQKALEGFERGIAPVGTSYALANLAGTYAHGGKYAEALQFLERSRQMKAKFQRTDPVSLWQIGWVYRMQRKYPEALDHYQKSLDIYKEIKGWNFAAGHLDTMSQIYYLQGEYLKSLELADQAIAISRHYPNSWVSYTNSGYAKKALGRPKEARKDLEAAVEIIERLRSRSLDDPTSRGDLVEKVTRPYIGMVDLLTSEGDLSTALGYAERIRARYLLEILQTGKVDISKSMTAEELEKERQIKNQIAGLNTQIGAAKNSDSITDLRRKLDGKRLEYEDFITRMNVLHPGIKVNRGEMTPMTLNKAGALLKDEPSALIEFVVGEEEVFTFVVYRDAARKISLKVFPIAINDRQLATQIEAYRASVENGDPGFRKASQDLYDLLLKPAAPLLAGKTNLIIVPDGPLWNLPFQTLLDESGKYLIERAAVSYAPSLTALWEMSRKAKIRKHDAAYELLAIGNPSVGEATRERVKRVFTNRELDPIPEAEQLVKKLGEMYGSRRSKIYLGDEAREQTVKTESPKYRIVQFATHGILNNTSPMYSHLVFARSEKNPNEDGLLEAWELKDLDLRADMIILSACETARGRVSNGEGLIGMTWASFIAGAPTTVASQWRVEPGSTSELMLEFHRQLLSNSKVVKAEALRRASLKVMRTPRYRHPLYWGGFVMIGDAS